LPRGKSGAGKPREIATLVGSASADRRRTYIGVITVAVVVCAVSLGMYRAGWLEYERVARWAASMREWRDPIPTALIFLAVWCVATSLAFPALPLMVAGGALFGTGLGTVLSLAGSALGAIGGYFVAKLFSPDFLRRRISRRLPVAELSQDGGFLTLVRFRLLPFVPFAAVSYGSGLAGVSLVPYITSTIVGQLPSTVLYSYFADRLLRSAERGSKGVTAEVLVASLLALLLSFAPRLISKWAGQAK